MTYTSPLKTDTHCRRLGVYQSISWGHGKICIRLSPFINGSGSAACVWLGDMLPYWLIDFVMYKIIQLLHTYSLWHGFTCDIPPMISIYLINNTLNIHLYQSRTRSRSVRLFLGEMHSKMKLTDALVKNFRVAKVFRENTDRINSIDFSANGETLISSSDDDSIVIYDCQNGT